MKPKAFLPRNGKPLHHKHQTLLTTFLWASFGQHHRRFDHTKQTVLGRNNDRFPVGSLVVSSPSRFLRALEKIHNTWFEHWLISRVPKLMHHSKWFDDERDLKIGDIILFLKHDISFKNTYQYKMVENVKYSKEEKIRKVKIKHRNDNEKTKGDVQYAKNW